MESDYKILVNRSDLDDIWGVLCCLHINIYSLYHSNDELKSKTYDTANYNCQQIKDMINNLLKKDNLLF